MMYCPKAVVMQCDLVILNNCVVINEVTFSGTDIFTIFRHKIGFNHF